MANRQRVSVTCETCGRNFYPWYNTRQRFCSHKCHGVFLKTHPAPVALPGVLSVNWRGGRYTDKRDGYVYVRVGVGQTKSHKMKEHRLIMAEYLGRPLKHNEIVHHKNGNRADNRLENLELWVVQHPSGQHIHDIPEPEYVI
jgi:hypothetical protein